ncbi:MAG: radical SAM protein [Planctomycetes bacterium]|nr:radical SAM protein [Planctomycetota bacterium]
MKKLQNREHDFASKLQQASTIKVLREYITWQRDLRGGGRGQRPLQTSLPRGPALRGPISINLDLTSACNFACPFCVDSDIINANGYLELADIKKTIDVLQTNGLRSVILLGGGEPTLHKDFGEITRYIKSKDLELGIVTNGTRLDKVIPVADCLKKKDWVRLSIDAAREETFQVAHQPRIKTTLSQILNKAKELKQANPAVSLGYSFVIVWEGVEINGRELIPNINEMAEAVRLAAEYSFDYISFKPCLIRLPESKKESLLYQVDQDKEEKIRQIIKVNLRQAKETAGDKIKILESVNLKAILNKETGKIKKQPGRCHLQFFRTVVSPAGIFHCPAFRGVEKAKVGAGDGYSTETKFGDTLEAAARSIATFNATKECQVVGCFYHRVNWWIEDFINSEKNVSEIEEMEDDNFFL